jgi:uncharacterized protein DUF4352
MGVARGRGVLRPSAALVILSIAALPSAVCGQTHATSIEAHPLGAAVNTIIEFGDQYLGGDELYNAKITVLTVVRGGKAWEAVKDASASNPLPKAGYEYLLTRVRFEFSARTSPSHYNYDLHAAQFSATAIDGHEFGAPALVAAPKPELDGTLKPGDAVEGWVAFLVPQNAAKPLMVFHEDVGTVSHRGGGTWFQLYPQSATTGKVKP